VDRVGRATDHRGCIEVRRRNDVVGQLGPAANHTGAIRLIATGALGRRAARRVATLPITVLMVMRAGTGVPGGERAWCRVPMRVMNAAPDPKMGQDGKRRED